MTVAVAPEILGQNGEWQRRPGGGVRCCRRAGSTRRLVVGPVPIPRWATFDAGWPDCRRLFSRPARGWQQVRRSASRTPNERARMLFFRSTIIQFPPDTKKRGRVSERDFGRVELDIANDRHARAAMEAYADSCETEMPWLTEALRESRHSQPDSLTQCVSTVLRVFGLAQARAAGQSDYSHAAWEHVRAQLIAELVPPPPAANADAGSPERNVARLHV